MADDYELRQVEAQKDSLRDDMRRAGEMKSVASSPGGKALLKALKQDYVGLVTAAVRSSEKYSMATRAIENIFSMVGETISLEEAAGDMLARLESKEEPSEDY